MTDQVSAQGTGALVEPEHRGRIDIADRVVERIAAYAASDVAGVVQFGSKLDSLVGRQYPKVSAEVAGLRTRIGVEIAVSWPSSLGDIAAAVRDAVRTRVHDLAGLEVDAVDVTAAKVVLVTPPSPRRVQ